MIPGWKVSWGSL